MGSKASDTLCYEYQLLRNLSFHTVWNETLSETWKIFWIFFWCDGKYSYLVLVFPWVRDQCSINEGMLVFNKRFALFVLYFNCVNSIIANFFFHLFIFISIANWICWIYWFWVFFLNYFFLLQNRREKGRKKQNVFL